MNDTKETKEKKESSPAKAAEDKKKDSPRKGGRGSSSSHQKNPRRSKKRRGRRPRSRSEFDQKIVDIRRVTRVVAGGRRFSFSVAMVIGDRKGRVGLGVGKANDIALAIEKAANNGEKNLVKLDLTENNSIPHEIHAKYNASQVVLRPSPGRGLVSGSSVRDVVELAGITDVSSKLLSRSKNKINNARAAIKALQKLSR